MAAAPPSDPELAELLASLRAQEVPLEGSDLAEVRLQWASRRDGVVLSERVTRTDHRIPGPPGAPEVTIRVHRPKDFEGPGPCIISLHGGGYVGGSLLSEDAHLDRWCPLLGCVGVSVEYRLAPETPYPGPLEDCYAALAFVTGHAGELGVDPARIGIAGFSAGGGLAAGLALLARDRGELSLAFQLLVYPMIDDRMVTASSQWDVPSWSPANNAFGWRCYLGALSGSDEVPPYAAAARAQELGGLPRTFICVGTLDGFCDEDIAYAARLIDAGVDTELHVYPGAPHGFDFNCAGTTIARRSVRDLEEWLAATLARGA